MTQCAPRRLAKGVKVPSGDTIMDSHAQRYFTPLEQFRLQRFASIVRKENISLAKTKTSEGHIQILFVMTPQFMQ
jgi:hypothetical protein